MELLFPELDFDLFLSEDAGTLGLLCEIILDIPHMKPFFN